MGITQARARPVGPCGRIMAAWCGAAEHTPAAHAAMPSPCTHMLRPAAPLPHSRTHARTYKLQGGAGGEWDGRAGSTGPLHNKSQGGNIVPARVMGTRGLPARQALLQQNESPAALLGATRSKETSGNLTS